MEIKAPQLEQRFLEPPGWRWHHLKNKDSKKLRFGTAFPESRIPAAVVVILPGRTEYAEKYFEVANDLLKSNLSVWILEWQGQGLSDRYLKNRERGHSSPFEDHVSDLHEFILEYVKHACVHPDVGRIPMVMLAHSMGANIGMRYLHAHPNMFECAALTAPLLGMQDVNKIPAAPLISHVMSLLCGSGYAFGQKNWAACAMPELFSQDPIRNKVYDSWLEGNESLRLGGVTFGWVYQALRSCMILNQPETLKAITTPLLVALAGRDHIVDNDAIRRAVTILPDARFIELPDAGHEILMERDESRNLFLTAFMDLIRERILDRPESLKTF